MPSEQKWNIPDDYTEGVTDWSICVMCIPNTQKWRGIVSGAIYNLTRGRLWNESTGTIKEVQQIGERIYDSMAIDCSNVWERIATAQESINEKTPDLITLAEFLEDLEDSTIGDLADWITIGELISGMLPSISIKLSPVDWIRMVMEILWKRRIAKAAEDIAFQLKISNLVEGGETVAEGVEAIDGVIDDISDWASILIQGLGATSSAVSAYGDLRDLFSTEGANNDLELRNINRVYNDVFVEGDAMTNIQQNTQIVNCGGGDLCGEFPEETPAGSGEDEGEYDNTLNDDDYPSGFDSLSEFQSYKCKAAWGMSLNLAESIYQFYSVAHSQLGASNRSSLITMIVQAIKTTDFMFGAGAIYNVSLWNSLIQWEAEQIVDYIYDETDLSPFDIFYDLRLSILSDVEMLACPIYTLEDTASIKAGIMAYVDNVFATYSYTATIKSWARAVIEDMLLNAWLNIPFRPYENINGAIFSPAEDCEHCDTIYEDDWEMVAGTLVSGSLDFDSDGFVIQAAYIEELNCNRWELNLVAPVGYDWEIDVSRVGGGLPKGCTANTKYYNAVTDQYEYVYYENEPLPDTFCIQGGTEFWIRYTSSWVATIEVEGFCNE